MTNQADHRPQLHPFQGAHAGHDISWAILSWTHYLCEGTADGNLVVNFYDQDGGDAIDTTLFCETCQQHLTGNDLGLRDGYHIETSDDVADLPGASSAEVPA
jgi:hypothetical protein